MRAAAAALAELERRARAKLGNGAPLEPASELVIALADALLKALPAAQSEALAAEIAPAAPAPVSATLTEGEPKGCAYTPTIGPDGRRWSCQCGQTARRGTVEQVEADLLRHRWGVA